MKRRCSFLDNLPAFNFNSGYGEYQLNEQGNRVATDTSKLGSTLMGTMLKEVGDFCDPAIKENWSLKPHQQVIPSIEYKLILAALIDSEQMLLSIEAQLCTRRECKCFDHEGFHQLQCSVEGLRGRNVCTLYMCTAVLQCSITFVLKVPQVMMRNDVSFSLVDL